MNKRELRINHTTINDKSNCYVIAEIGHNHQGSFETCKKMIEIAKDCGVDAVKLQKRDSKSLYTEEFFNSHYSGINSYGDTYGTHREALEFNEDEFAELKIFADKLKIDFIATAFDFKSAEFLNQLDITVFKTASADLKNIPLLKNIASYGKPVIISTGAGTIEDVNRVYDNLSCLKATFSLLQCTATYPADINELDLNVIKTYRELFTDIVIGFSAHDKGIINSLIAYSLGAGIIEKHFTLDHKLKGTDHKFSLDPSEMKNLTAELKNVKSALGNNEKTFYESEKNAYYKMGKKIVASRELQAGHIISFDDLAFKSPGDGIPPYNSDSMIGKKLITDVGKDENLNFVMLE